MDTDISVWTAPAPVTWLDPATAREALTPLLGPDDGVDFLLVKVDPTNSHHWGPLYRQARYVFADGQELWFDAATAMRLYNVVAWACAE